MNITDPHYLMQSSEEVWQILQEARDYLHAYLHEASSRIYDEDGVVHFDASEWGYKVDNGCTVCLAGLWYLRKENLLLGEMMWDKLPQIADFLDDLRYLDSPSKTITIKDWLGINIPHSLDTELAMKASGYDHWDEDNPYHILAFLNWLLERRPARTLQSDEPT